LANHAGRDCIGLRLIRVKFGGNLSPSGTGARTRSVRTQNPKLRLRGGTESALAKQFSRWGRGLSRYRKSLHLPPARLCFGPPPLLHGRPRIQPPPTTVPMQAAMACRTVRTRCRALESRRLEGKKLCALAAGGRPTLGGHVMFRRLCKYASAQVKQPAAGFFAPLPWKFRSQGLSVCFAVSHFPTECACPRDPSTSTEAIDSVWWRGRRKGISAYRSTTTTLTLASPSSCALTTLSTHALQIFCWRCRVDADCFPLRLESRDWNLIFFGKGSVH